MKKNYLKQVRSLFLNISLKAIFEIFVELEFWIFFFSGFEIFKSYKENPVPTSASKRLIKTGIFAYTRNPIYLSFVLFHFSMFLVFENVMYFLTSIILFIWINNYVIKPEEEYLTNTFGDEYIRYKEAVSKWIIF